MRFSTPSQDPRPLLALRDPNAVLDAVTVTRPDATIVAVNRAFTRMHGYEAAEVIGATPRLLNSGRQSPSTYTELWSTVQHGGVWVGELVDQNRDGRLRSIRSEVTPVHDHRGRLVRIVAIQRDLGALLGEETLDSAGYLRLDGHGRCVGADLRVASRFATEPAELLGLGWLHALDRFDVEATLDAVGLAVETGRTIKLDVLDPWGDAMHLVLVPESSPRGPRGAVTVLVGPDGDHALR